MPSNRDGPFDPQHVVHGLGNRPQMTDDRQQFAAPDVVAQDLQGALEGRGVQGAESFIEKEALQAGAAAAVHLHQRSDRAREAWNVSPPESVRELRGMLLARLTTSKSMAKPSPPPESC
ncbi:hypothetical protein [Streptomyces sp. NPDC001893]|uniref:hypothetical protein n=1 Tax=Streptomyces sp. NPDC001893 TaxID=3154530 RepID=UPI003323F9B4